MYPNLLFLLFFFYVFFFEYFYILVDSLPFRLQVFYWGAPKIHIALTVQPLRLHLVWYCPH